MTERVKFGYLSYDDMIARLESGELNEYDVIYSRDKLITYLISEDLKPIELRSRVYVFSSVKEAEIALNQNTDTYSGQIVAILDKDTYRGYIVNLNNDIYKVTPLYEHAEPIDYDTLGNRPISNLVGTLDNPIIISDLDSGVYLVKGQYNISLDISTIYLSTSGTLFIVEHTDESVLIKKITSKEIIDYIVTDTTISNSYITKDFLDEKGYTTTAYVNEKIAALDFITKKEAEMYVKQIIEESIETVIEEKVNNVIDEKLVEVTDKKVQDLFN